MGRPSPFAQPPACFPLGRAGSPGRTVRSSPPCPVWTYCRWIRGEAPGPRLAPRRCSNADARAGESAPLETATACSAEHVTDLPHPVSGSRPARSSASCVLSPDPPVQALRTRPTKASGIHARVECLVHLGSHPMGPVSPLLPPAQADRRPRAVAPSPTRERTPRDAFLLTDPPWRRTRYTSHDQPCHLAG